MARGDAVEYDTAMASLFRHIFGKAGQKTPAKKFAAAYRFPDRLVLHSQLQTPYGGFAAEPFRVLPLDVGSDAVGAAVLEVLNASRKADDTPQGREFGKWYLQQMGVKSNAQLQRGTLSVGLVMDDGKIIFSPSHNGGTSGDRKGFQPIESAAVSVAIGASPAEVAAMLRAAFDRCTSVYT